VTSRSATALARALPLALSLVVAASACGLHDSKPSSAPLTSSPSGDPDTGDPDAGDPDAGGGAAPLEDAVCSADAKAASLPQGFPGSFPLPHGTTVTKAEKRSDARVILTAVTSTKFHATLRFLQTKVPAAGFALREGEVEEHDAESNWEGNGFRGRWAIREIPDCGGDVLVQVLSQPTD
jgi:hypothetical protein